MVAILQGRMTDAAGNPACARSRIWMSPGQDRFSALVIMTTQRRDSFSPMGPADTTNAGRCWRVARSV